MKNSGFVVFVPAAAATAAVVAVVIVVHVAAAVFAVAASTKMKYDCRLFVFSSIQRVCVYVKSYNGGRK